MSAQIAAYGRLGADPVQRQSQAGNPWTTATLAVSIGEVDNAPPQWFQLVAFGRMAEALARHSKGDLVSVAGRLQASHWRDREGQNRHGLQIIADTVISARSVRPGGRKREAGQ